MYVYNINVVKKSTPKPILQHEQDFRGKSIGLRHFSSLENSKLHFSL